MGTSIQARDPEGNFKNTMDTKPYLIPSDFIYFHYKDKSKTQWGWSNDPGYSRIKNAKKKAVPDEKTGRNHLYPKISL